VADRFTELPEAGLWVPDHAAATTARVESANVTIDNQTELSDRAILDYFEENTAAFGWDRAQTNFSIYGGADGSMMARGKFRAPQNIIDEIKLSRELAEKDDDVALTIDTLIAAALSDGYSNQHADEQVEHTFDKITEDMDLPSAFAELYREFLITGQINALSVFVRANYEIRPEGVSRRLTRSVARPMLGVLPAENIRVLGNDVLRTGQLLYVPDAMLERWLREYFGDGTTEARKAAMRREDPLAAALFTGPVQVPFNDMDLFGGGQTLWGLNPDMVHRVTHAKGSWKYPRPFLTRNFSLLEAKRLLNVMDHALLQGGTNYIVLAKKGSEKQPGLPDEIANLRELVKRASHSGAIIGDHRVSLEVITPDLTHLLDPEKRQMIGRKLSGALLRVPEFGSDDTGQAVATFAELLSRVITQDRTLIRDLIHRSVWNEVMRRNRGTFGSADRPLLWFSKIVLQGNQFFLDYLLKMYDRGDLPRKVMVEYGGFNYLALKAQKKREVAAGDDEVFMPPQVPFSSPQNGPGGAPQDNGPGRPPGSGPNNGAPGATPRSNSTAPRSRSVRRTPGEAVRAYFDDDLNEVVRIGELTDAMLEEYPEAIEGRLTAIERRALGADDPGAYREGSVIVIPVNVSFPIEDAKAVRLDEGLSILVGCRARDGAIMAAALCFKEPHYNLDEAEDMAVRWGFENELTGDDGGAPGDGGGSGDCPNCGMTQPGSNAYCASCGTPGPFGMGHLPRRRHRQQNAVELHLHPTDGDKPVTHRIERDDDGQITAIVEEPAERP
jgi:hypothetical protein